MFNDFSILNNLLPKIDNSVKNELSKQKHNASGKGIESINTKLKEDILNPHITTYGEDYLIYVNRGRPKGIRGVPVRELMKYIQVIGFRNSTSKNLRSSAFAMMKSIKAKGIPSKPYVQWTEGNSIERIGFIDNALKKISSILVNTIEMFVVRNIELKIIKLFK